MHAALNLFKLGVKLLKNYLIFVASSCFILIQSYGHLATIQGQPTQLIEHMHSLVCNSGISLLLVSIAERVVYVLFMTVSKFCCCEDYML